MTLRFATLTLAAVLSLGAATGCRPALVPLTQEMREQNHLTDGELKNLQYYVSHTITLRRELESGGRQVTGNHKLVLVNGKTIEEVVVEAQTPGICVGVDAHRLQVSFEQGTSFTFVPAQSQGSASPGGFASPPDVNPFPGNERPRPAATDGLFSGNYMLWSEPSGSIPFMGKAFEGLEETPKVTLMIDAESLQKVVKKHKVLPGLVLTNH
jgi:hypothetical protein